MAWKIHRENANAKPIGGTRPWAHIVPETPPLLIVETQDEAKAAMARMIADGMRPCDLYAVGYDL